MAIDDKTQPNQSKDQQYQGGPNRSNPNTPSGVRPGQEQSEGNAGNKPEEQELDEQGRVTGQMSNQKEANRFAGTSSGGTQSGTSGRSGPGKSDM